MTTTEIKNKTKSANHSAQDLQMIRTAIKNLNSNARRLGRVLMPESEAWVEYAEFDPCRANQLIARVYVPGIQNCKPQTFCWGISEGDAI